MTEPAHENVLLRRVSRAMFWNASMLPLIAAINLLAAVMIRRGFGLQSGIYDVALGVLNTLIAYSELGMPAAVTQFVPQLERTGQPREIAHLLRRAVGVRFGILLVVLVPFTVYAPEIAERLHLGPGGAWLLHVVSVLAVFRAGTDLAIDVLQGLLAHVLANLVQLVQALVLAGAVAWTLLVSAPISSLFVRLAAGAMAVTVGSALLARRELGVLESRPTPSSAATQVGWRSLWGFALFMYVFEMSNYFVQPAFASPTLAAISGGPATVALFNVAFQIPLMVVVVILAGFQGLYRPLFAGVLAERSADRIRIAFSEVSKVQAILLIPAGVGLGLILPDYITLLFTKQFAAAAPLARVLCACLFVEALLNLGNILLSADHRYALSLTGQALRIVGALGFVWLAIRGDILMATLAFGMGRVLASGFGFLMARHVYGVRLPMAFVARVGLSALVMGAVVAFARLLLSPSWLATSALTMMGAVVALLGVRWFKALGPREIDLLRRAGLPGRVILLQWFAAGDTPSR